MSLKSFNSLYIIFFMLNALHILAQTASFYEVA